MRQHDSGDATRADDPLRERLESIVRNRAAWERRMARGRPVQDPVRGPDDEDDPLQQALMRLVRRRLQPPRAERPQRCEACNEHLHDDPVMVRLATAGARQSGDDDLDSGIVYYFCERCANQTRGMIEWLRREAR